MTTSKQDAQAERARAIAEALQASGARSLMELLAGVGKAQRAS